MNPVLDEVRCNTFQIPLLFLSLLPFLQDNACLAQFWAETLDCSASQEKRFVDELVFAETKVTFLLRF